MTTPKFMDFDEAKLAIDSLKEYPITTYSADIFHDKRDGFRTGARYQHQRDLVVMKKLMEIIVEQERCLDAIDDHLRDLQAERIIDMNQMIRSLKILSIGHAQVETMLKELEK